MYIFICRASEMHPKTGKNHNKDCRGNHERSDSDSMQGWANVHVQGRKFNKSAAEFIADQISKDPGNVSILALGPLTNIAMAFQIGPEVARDIVSLSSLSHSSICFSDVSPPYLLFLLCILSYIWDSSHTSSGHNCQICRVHVKFLQDLAKLPWAYWRSAFCCISSHDIAQSTCVCEMHGLQGELVILGGAFDVEGNVNPAGSVHTCMKQLLGISFGPQFALLLLRLHRLTKAAKRESTLNFWADADRKSSHLLCPSIEMKTLSEIL